MLERERREDQVDRLVIMPSATGRSGRGDQSRFAGRIMKSPREVLIRPIALSLAAILLTTVLVAEAYSDATALHIRDPEDLALAFLLPTIFITVFFDSTLAVASSFVCGLAAAYVIYPPQTSIWIDDPTHVAELGFIVLLAITASKAVGVIVDGKPLGSSGARAESQQCSLACNPGNAFLRSPSHRAHHVGTSHSRRTGPRDRMSAVPFD